MVTIQIKQNRREGCALADCFKPIAKYDNFPGCKIKVAVTDLKLKVGKIILAVDGLKLEVGKIILAVRSFITAVRSFITAVRSIITAVGNNRMIRG